MSGTIAVGEVFGSVLPELPRDKPREKAPAGLDREAVRAMLRRDGERRARLVAD